jgi:hypothetical protein
MATSGPNIPVTGTALPNGGYGVVLDTGQIIAQLCKESNTRLAKWANESFAQSRKSSRFREQIKQVNIDLAEDTRKVIYNSYKRGKKKRQVYRQQDRGKNYRYANKKMDRAINDKNFIKGDASGITINFTVLNSYAKQWSRLNFGAQPAGSKSVSDQNIKIFRRNLRSSPTLSKFGARPGFLTPSSQMSKRSGKGFRSVGVSSSRAYPGTPDPRSIVQTPRGRYLYVYRFKTSGLGARGFYPKQSKGIVGWRFLDQGIAYMNKEYGPRMTKALDSWTKEVAKNAKKAASKQSGRTRVRIK